MEEENIQEPKKVFEKLYSSDVIALIRYDGGSEAVDIAEKGGKYYFITTSKGVPEEVENKEVMNIIEEGFYVGKKRKEDSLFPSSFFNSEKT